MTFIVLNWVLFLSMSTEIVVDLISLDLYLLAVYPCSQYIQYSVYSILSGPWEKIVQVLEQPYMSLGDCWGLLGDAE